MIHRSHPHYVSDTIQLLVEAVEKNPNKRWKTADFKASSIDESTARRQFKKRFGMTFVTYARARRIGVAIQEIRKSSSIINAQLEAGFELGSGFGVGKRVVMLSRQRLYLNQQPIERSQMQMVQTN